MNCKVLFSISDETECKTSNRAAADMKGSEWQGDKLYIVIGEIIVLGKALLLYSERVNRILPLPCSLYTKDN